MGSSRLISTKTGRLLGTTIAIQAMSDEEKAALVSRLRRAQGRELYLWGFDAGSEWARTTASLGELEEMGVLRSQGVDARPPEEWDGGTYETVMYHSLADFFEDFEREWPGPGSAPAGVSDHKAWISNGAYLAGFFAGALEIYEQVRGEL